MTKETHNTYWYLTRGTFPARISWGFSVIVTVEGQIGEGLCFRSSLGKNDRGEEACSGVGGFLGQNRNGVVAREKRGEQFGEGNWGFSSSIT